MKMFSNFTLKQLTKMKNRFYIEDLAEFYSNLAIKQIPSEVLAKAKMTLLDYLFVYIVGLNKGVLTNTILNYIKQKKSNEESSVYLSGIKTDTDLASFACSLIAHSVELDDGHRYGTAHPAVAVIPAALAIGEKENITINELLKAIIIGYDIMLRLSKSINPSHLKRGFHSTSTTGTIGSAAAASVILGFNHTQMTHALAISGLFSSGLQEMLHSNPSSKALQVGKSAQSGVSAALFASHGLKGPLSLFEGQHGWLKAMTDVFEESDLLNDLGKRWEIMNTYTKLYPTCRHCHHAIDLTIEAWKSGINIESIDNVIISTYSVGIAEVGIIKTPKDIEEAMFSITYAVAVAFQKGFVSYEDLEKNLDNSKLLSFSSSIEVRNDDEMDKNYPVKRGCKLELNLLSGERLIFKTDLPKGEPDTSLTNEEYLQKFKTITSGFVSSSYVMNLYNMLINEDSTDLTVRELIKYINNAN
jgi:2-methylcitrate dehydratase PrpD